MTHIPPSQAAYQSGHSTTEQVFTLKILAEKAITSENYDIFILMLDMSKAFDTVNWSKLMQTLHNILTPGELHMMYLLINNIIINVKIGDKTGMDILTVIGICQGDYLHYYLSSTWHMPSNHCLPTLIDPTTEKRCGQLWTG